MTDQPDPDAPAPDATPTSPAAQPGFDSRGCIAAGALILAVPCYLLSFVGTLESTTHNPEDGMITGFAILAEFPLWFGLAVLILLATGPARLSGAMVAAALAFIVAGAFASIAAFGLMGTHPDWRVVAPLLLPPLAVGFAFWLRRAPSMQPELRRRILLAFAGATFLLVAPIAWSVQQHEADLAARARQHAAEEARRAADFEALLRAPGKRLEQLVAWLDDDCPCDDMGFDSSTSRSTRAAEAIRRLPSRQSDAVRLLDGNFPLESLERLRDFNLAANPELCRAYGAALDRKVGELDPGNPEVGTALSQVSLQLPNIEWLAANRCDLSTPAVRAARLIRALPDGMDAGLANAIEAAVRSPAAAAPPCTPAPDDDCLAPPN